MAGAITAGDTLVAHGNWYQDRLIITKSGTVAAPITVQCGTDCLFWFSLDISGANNIVSDAQGATSSWRLVSGTTNLWKKGVSYVPYLMWVNGAQLPHGPTMPATQNDAGAIAVLGAPGSFIGTTEDLDGQANTVYYRGDLSTNMRANWTGAGGSQAANNYGQIIIHEQDYITLVNPKIKGWYPLAGENGALFIQGCTGCKVIDPVVYEGSTALKLQANTNLRVLASDRKANTCEIQGNILGGINIGGQQELLANGAVIQVSAITRANPGAVTTVNPHGLTNGEHIVMQGVQAMTQVNDVEYVATVVDSTHFTIGVDTSGFTAYSSAGRLFVQRTDNGTIIDGCYVHNNGNYPRFNGVDIRFNQDADGIGVGYLGGTVKNLRILNNKIHSNGPRRALLGGELGDIVRGSGMLLSTSYTMDVQNFLAQGNDFWNNHRWNLTIDDASSTTVVGNFFRGTVNYGTTLGMYQVRYGSLPDPSSNMFANNTLTGDSGQAALEAFNTTSATRTWKFQNNAFVNTVANAGTAGSPWLANIYLTNTTTNVTESNNGFYSVTSPLINRAGTSYATVGAWQSASSQGAGDSTADPKYVGGAVLKGPKAFALRQNSPYIGAGARVGRYSGFNCGFDPALLEIGAMARCPGDARTTTLSPRTTALSPAP